MQEPFCASRNKYTNTWNCLPLPARFHFTARACLWGVKGINSSHKIFQVACQHLSCALCKWKQGAWYLPASVSHTRLMDVNLTQTDTWELLKNVSMLFWRIFNIFYQNWDLEIALDTGIYQKEKATTVGTSGFAYSKHELFLRVHPSYRLYLNSQDFRRQHQVLLPQGDQPSSVL